MGLRVLQRMIKVLGKLRLYYPHELENFNNIWEEEEYWDDYMRKCCPELEGLIDLEN
jgi:hypothetical protein